MAYDAKELVMMSAQELYQRFVESYQKSRPPLDMTPPKWNELSYHERMAWEGLVEFINAR